MSGLLLAPRSQAQVTRQTRATKTYTAVIGSVYDGDTATNVTVQLGLGTLRQLERVRLSGINSPEMKTKDAKPQQAGSAAKSHLAKLLGILPATVTLQTFLDARDDYGRYIVRIITHDGQNVNQAMLDDGFAVPLGPYPA
jgi:endonuclease YncB( thermonuclease family)